MIQFVLVDKEFRDLLVSLAEQKKWETRHIRGLIWVYPVKHLVLQVGQDTVTFYSDEPKDLSWIATWARKMFSADYEEIDSLVSRIKSPQDLSAEELTIVIKHQGTIAGIRSQIQMYQKHGVYSLPAPNEITPGLKVYEFNNTMRVEFIIHGNSQGSSAMNMLAELAGLMPRIHKTHGIFWEFVQKYYSHALHPTMIDVGGHDFLQALDKITGKFTDVLHEFMQARPVQAILPEAEDPLNGMVEAVETLDGFDIEAIIKAAAATLKLERQAVLVYLAAWSAWAGRNFKGRVLKEDISKLLLNDAKEPTPLPVIAEAIEQLQKAGLMQRDARYDVKFSPAGIMLARKLTAKREMVE